MLFATIVLASESFDPPESPVPFPAIVQLRSEPVMRSSMPWRMLKRSVGLPSGLKKRLWKSEGLKSSFVSMSISLSRR